MALLRALRAFVLALVKGRYVLDDDGAPKRVWPWTRVASNWTALARRIRAKRVKGKEPFQLRASWDLDIVDTVTGRRRHVALGENLIVTAGLNALKDRMFNPSTAQAVFGYMAIGTGSTPETAADTALGAESRRAAVTYAAGGAGVAVITRIFAADGTARTYAEAGLFDASSSGTMFNRKVFDSAVPIGTTENVTCVCTITASNG
jgi:hypothetical protein